MPLIPPTCRAVIFDAVGTVLHPSPGAPAVYADAAARFGLAADPVAILARFSEAFQRQEEIDRSAGWATSEERERERWQAIVRETLPGSPAECFELLYGHFARPEAWATPPGAAAVFDALAARGLVLGIGSNYDLRLETVLAGRPELNRLRGTVVISSVVGIRKPHPRFFETVAESAGCGLDEVLFVGDDLDNDFDGATAAGMPAVLIDPRGRYPGVTPRIADLAELVGSR